MSIEIRLRQRVGIVIVVQSIPIAFVKQLAEQQCVTSSKPKEFKD